MMTSIKIAQSLISPYFTIYNPLSWRQHGPKNNGVLSKHYMASQPRRTWPEYHFMLCSL